MAISKNLEIENGLSLNGAYIRIDSVSGSKNSLVISANAYTSKESFLQGNEYLKNNIYQFIPSVEDNSENFIKQGYEYLKSLEEYKDAIDV